MDLNPIDPGLVAVALAAIAIGGLFKGMTGLGLPIFAVPALAVFMSVEDAVVLMIIPALAANLWLVVTHRNHRALLREHLPFLTSGFVGSIAGTTLLVVLDDRWLKLILAAWLGVYLLQYFFAGNSLRVFRGHGRTAYLLGASAGTIQGATGISAQIIAPYYHGRGLKPEAYAFLVAFTFLLFGVAQSSAAFATDLFTPQRLQLSFIATIPALLFTRIGIHYAGKVSQQMFDRILLVTFVLMELKLVADIVRA